MKVLVTGAKGFVGKNLCLALRSLHLQKNHPLAEVPMEIFEYDLDNTPEELDRWIGECDFVFHLAGVNRPKDVGEFRTGNTVFTEDILEKLEGLTQRNGGTESGVGGTCHGERGEHGEREGVWGPAAQERRGIPVLLASSTQAALENDYGRSKKAAEEAVFAYGERTGAPVYVYRFANVFGKWCRPNYNSAVATWCYNIAHDLPIQVRDPKATVTLIYIDDLVGTLIGKLVNAEKRRNGEGERISHGERGEHGEGVCRSATQEVGRDILSVEPSYTRTLGEITELIRSFHAEPTTLQVPDQADGFAKKLYATYLSYLPEDKFSYPLTMHCDNRGSFTEVLHTLERGQVSVNISKPGITKGQHWHHTKHEKFCVVSGEGVIQFRKMVNAEERRNGEGEKVSRVERGERVEAGRPAAQEVIEYRVSGERIEVVRIPPGYTHNIINVGKTDMVTLMWANEVFDPQNPDTFKEEV